MEVVLVKTFSLLNYLHFKFQSIFLLENNIFSYETKEITSPLCPIRRSYLLKFWVVCFFFIREKSRFVSHSKIFRHTRSILGRIHKFYIPNIEF